MKASYRLQGMTCVNCARTVEIALSRKEGVKKVRVSFELGRLEVEFDPEKISEREIVRTVEELGYRVVQEESFKKDLFLLGFCAFASLTIMTLMFIPFRGHEYVQLVLSTLVQIVGGMKFYRGAYNGLRNRVANMDLLVSIGTTASYVYSLLAVTGFIDGKPFFETNAFLITFVRGGRLVEEISKRRALKKLKDLLSFSRWKVTVLEGNREVKRNVREVFKGDTVIYRKGDMVLLDGTVVEGKAYLSEAVLTGEPDPIPKGPSDEVISGSIVEEGFLKVRVTRIYEESYLSKLARSVDLALAEKPKIQRIADRVSHYFVQVVMLISLFVFLLWYLMEGDLQKAVQFSLAVLVISCPCAFGIAVPLAVAVGVSKFLEKGILIKKPSVVEIIPKINLVIFDKTGTVTEGKFVVKEFRAFDERALDIAYSMEVYSNHPVAEAIREFAREKGSNKVILEGCKEEIGKGIRCGEYFIGSDLSTNGKRIVLKKGDSILAEFLLEDRVREEAKAVIKRLKAMGLRTLLLSGDKKEITSRIARELGFDDFLGEVPPEGKKDKVRELQRKGFKVAMVGDGLNDAPALAQADLPVAVKHGVDITKQVGDVILLKGISALPDMFTLGRKVNAKIKQNLIWAFIYNVVGIPVAGGALYSFGITLKPEMAGLMMALSSLSVVLNTVTLKRA